jgi:hypothetical protein
MTSSNSIRSGAAPKGRPVTGRLYVLPVVREVPLPPPDAGSGGSTW